MRYLKTNTATIVTVGPFLDKTDGVTIETGLTITNERISFVVDANDGSAPTLVLDNVTGATSGTSNDLNYITGCDAGLMQLELAAANVNYLGRAFLTVTDAANHCPVFHEFTILPAMVYDSLIAGTDVLQSDMTQILGTAVSTPATAGLLDVNAIQLSGDATAANNAESFFDGTGYAGTNNVIPLVTTTTTATNVTTVNGLAANVITATSIAADAITAAKIAAGAIDNATFAADVGSTAYATNIIALAADKAIVNYGALKPTTAGRTLDVTATGAAGIDWGNIENPTTSQALYGTSIDSVSNAGIASVEIGAITASAFAAGAIDAAALAADAVTEIQSGLATAANLATVAGYIDTEVASILAAVDTEVAAIKAVTDKVDTALVLDGAVYQYTANALELAPTGGSAPTAAAIADAVWDEVLSGHLTAGTTGNALNAAGSAGDPWSTALPGAYGAGTAGKLIGDNINAPIATVDTVVDAIKAKTDNLPSDPADQSAVEAAITAAASSLATAANLATVAGYLDTEIAAILADTNELQTDWVNGGRLDLLIDAIKAKTDTIPASPAEVGSAMTLAADAVSASALSAAAVDEILDEVVEGSTTVRQVLRALLSLAAGKTTRAGSTIYFRDFGDTKNRLSLTVDSNADRTAVSTDLT